MRIAKGSAHDLPSGFTLYFATHGTATVADVLAATGRLDGQALADPIEGPEYGITTAKFYANARRGAGRAVIHSFAHGAETNYFLNPETTKKIPVTIIRHFQHFQHFQHWRGFQTLVDNSRNWGLLHMAVIRWQR